MPVLRSGLLGACGCAAQFASSCSSSVADLLSWEAQFLSVKAGKAPGPDGLGSSAVKMAIPQVAFHSYTLTLMERGHVRVPQRPVE